MADIFSDAPLTEGNEGGSVDIGLNDLVGEGRKYKDPDALAKAYANIEAHARRLEAENAEARAKLDTRDFKATTNNSSSDGQDGNNPSHSDQNGGTPQDNAPPKQDVDFRSQIREEVKALNEQERMTQNIEQTAAKMVETYGSPQAANEALRKRAQELGVGVDWLRDSAARSPAAFYATMGIQSSGGSSPRMTPASGGGVNLGTGGEPTRNFEYYEKIRKDNPKLYFSSATQQEMLRQARAMGDNFYKR